MKKIIVMLFFVGIAGSAVAQKLGKEEMEAKIDSLTKANVALVAKNDTLNKQLLSLVAVYDTLKAAYIKKDFTAQDVRPALDSLIKDASSATDSLTEANKELQAKIDVLTTGAEASQKEKDQVVKDLTTAKALLDQGILSEEEFNAIKKKYISKL